jgi:hypothetical protein
MRIKGHMGQSGRGLMRLPCAFLFQSTAMGGQAFSRSAPLIWYWSAHCDGLDAGEYSLNCRSRNFVAY